MMPRVGTEQLSPTAQMLVAETADMSDSSTHTGMGVLVQDEPPVQCSMPEPEFDWVRAQTSHAETGATSKTSDDESSVPGGCAPVQSWHPGPAAEAGIAPSTPSPHASAVAAAASRTRPLGISLLRIAAPRAFLTRSRPAIQPGHRPQTDPHR